MLVKSSLMPVSRCWGTCHQMGSVAATYQSSPMSCGTVRSRCTYRSRSRSRKPAGWGTGGAEWPLSPHLRQDPTPAQVLPAARMEARPKNMPRVTLSSAEGSSLRLARKGSMTRSFRGTKASKTTASARSSQAPGNCGAEAGQAPAPAGSGSSASRRTPASHEVRGAAGPIPHRGGPEGAAAVLVVLQGAGDVEVQSLQVIGLLQLKGNGMVAPWTVSSRVDPPPPAPVVPARGRAHPAPHLEGDHPVRDEGRQHGQEAGQHLEVLEVFLRRRGSRLGSAVVGSVVASLPPASAETRDGVGRVRAGRVQPPPTLPPCSPVPGAPQPGAATAPQGQFDDGRDLAARGGLGDKGGGGQEEDEES